MTDKLTPGHSLLLEFVDLPELLDGLPRDADLLSAGLNSGDLIRLALAVEDRTGTSLDDEALGLLHTLDGIDQVLAAGHRAEAMAAADKEAS
jgi:hypothetical protein